MNKDFEKKKIGYVVMMFFIFLFFIIIGSLGCMKIFQYKMFNAVVVNDELIVVVVDSSKKKLFYQNKNMFIDGEKISFSISKVDNEMYKNKVVLYLEVLSHEYEENAIITISILEKKISAFKIFDIIWR